MTDLQKSVTPKASDSQADTQFEEAYQEVKRFIANRTDVSLAAINLGTTYRILAGDRTFAEGWRIGFGRCMAMFAQSKPDTYKIVTGHAGFVKLYKNGQRAEPKNFEMEFKL